MDGVKEDRKSVDVRESQCVYHLPKGERNGAGMRAKNTCMLNLLESNNFSEFQSQSGFWPTRGSTPPLSL